MANHLPRAKQVAVARCLINGLGVRGAERMTGVHRDTIGRLFKDLKAGAIVDIEAEAREMMPPDPLEGATERRKRTVGQRDHSGRVVTAVNVQAAPATIDATDAQVLMVGLRALAAAKGYRVPRRDDWLLEVFREQMARNGVELVLEEFPRIVFQGGKAVLGKRLSATRSP